MNTLQANISDISSNYYHYLINLQNVKGIGVGYKFINGKQTNELSIHVLVDKKVNVSYLTYNNIIPKTYMGIKTDVIEIGTPRILGIESELFNKYRPLKGGCGIYAKDANLDGTLGCIVVKKKILGNKYFILSNNHVLADSNTIPIGREVIQPSSSHGGKFPQDIVAKLSNFIEIKFEHGISKLKNYVDCAIAEVTNKSLISKEVLKIGKITGAAKANLNDHVRKTGITSGLTDGKIISINTTIEIEFDNNKKVFFANQQMALLPSSKGDSGSVVINDKNEVIGLLFATGRLNTTFINDINLVLKALKIDIYK